MSDLTDRMRTCAAYIVTVDGARNVDDWGTAVLSAADLLIEASNALEAIPEPLGEPMEIIEAVAAIEPSPPPNFKIDYTPKAVWTTNAGDLPAITGHSQTPRPNRVCPKCDSRAAKRVFRNEAKLFLACPACAAAWEYRP